MKFYLHLQYKMLQRQLRAFGVPPLLGYLLVLLSFVGGSWLLYFKLPQAAPYLYLFIATSSLSSLSQKQRTDFLKVTFSPHQYYPLRCLENLLVALGFILYLCYQADYIFALVLLGIAIGLAFINWHQQRFGVIPTPFYRYPFEFIVGFRKGFLFPLLAYFLCGMGLWVNNFNLSLFSLPFTILLCCSYYGEPEQGYFAWIFAYTPQAFIWKKMKIAFGYATLLALPITLSLAIFFPQKLLLIFGLQLLASLYLIAVVLAKYAVFPRRINLAQAILLALCLAFPPFLLGVIPFFYQKTIQQLKAVLS